MAGSESLDVAANPSRAVILRTLFVHLRLHFQVLLAPIFLWGYFLAGSAPTAKFWLALLAFHVFLYGGTTVFNSYYDRDVGPIGGLAKPPPVVQAMLPFSLAVQGAGAFLALAVNWTFALIYLVIFAMGWAYSYPGVRWKARPIGGLLTVAIGQGVLGALGGWAAANPNLATITRFDWLGLVAAALITVGFYPLTQIYQIEEDLARGDKTFAAWAGPQGAFAFALVVQSVAAVTLIVVIARLLGGWNALVVAIGYGGLLVTIAHWAYTFDGAQVLRNFRRVMRINTITSWGFIGFISLHLFGWL